MGWSPKDQMKARMAGRRSEEERLAEKPWDQSQRLLPTVGHRRHGTNHEGHC